MAGFTGVYYSDTQTAYLKPAVLEKLLLQDPDATTLTAFLQLTKGKNIGVMAPTFNWFEDDNVGRWTTIPAGAGDGDLSIAVTSGDGWKVQAGTVLYVPRTGETMLVSAESSGTITVTRSNGATAAANLNANEPIMILGKAFAEGASKGTAGASLKTAKSAYTQIFRNAFDATGTMLSTQTYSGGDNIYGENKKKALIQHLADQDAAAFWGEASSGGSGSTLRRTTGGLREIIVSYATGVNGAMSEAAFNDIVRPTYEVGSTEKILACSAQVAQIISSYSTNKLQTQIGQTTYGNRIKTYASAAGDLTIVPCRKSLYGPTAGRFFVVDKMNVSRLFLNGNGISRDTTLKEYNMENTSADATSGEWLTESGFMFQFEKSMAYAYGITG